VDAGGVVVVWEGVEWRLLLLLLLVKLLEERLCIL
jgi:hypothetical protein